MTDNESLICNARSVMRLIQFQQTSASLKKKIHQTSPLHQDCVYLTFTTTFKTSHKAQSSFFSFFLTPIVLSYPIYWWNIPDISVIQPI